MKWQTVANITVTGIWVAGLLLFFMGTVFWTHDNPILMAAWMLWGLWGIILVGSAWWQKDWL